MSLGLQARNEILGTSLLIESLTSAFISGLLGIKDFRNSKTLGNKSTSLSFKQKIDLLIDLGALDSDKKNKFLSFMEIRNQFMHNLDAASYTKCFSYLPGKEKFVLELYPPLATLPIEDQLKNACSRLGSDVLNITSKILDYLVEKINKDQVLKVSELSNNAFIESIKISQTEFNDLIEKLTEGKESISNASLKGLGGFFIELIRVNWQKSLDKLTNEGS